MTPPYDCLPLGRSLPSSACTSELLYFLSANPASPSAFASYANTLLYRLLLSVLMLSVMLLLLPASLNLLLILSALDGLLPGPLLSSLPLLDLLSASSLIIVL